jgi:hypothetical protein
MKRYRLVITKFIYPPIFIICFVNGLKLCQILLQESTSLLERKGEDQFLNFYYSTFNLFIQFLFGLFFIFLVISFILLLKPPTMKKYKTSLKTVLEYENRNEDVLVDQGNEMRKETDYRLTAKRVYCPTCHTPTEGIIGTFKTCEYCGGIFEVT